MNVDEEKLLILLAEVAQAQTALKRFRREAERLLALQRAGQKVEYPTSVERWIVGEGEGEHD